MKRWNNICGLIFLWGVIGLIACNRPANSQSPPGGEKQETAAPPLTIFLVRHAEKGTDGNDPDLTEKGMDRAEDISRMLGAIRLDAVYSTPYKRTVQTGTPAAMSFGLEIQSYDPRNQDNLVREIEQKYPGGNVLIVGHSNTVPALLSHLDPAHSYPQMTDNEYDNFYVVTIQGKAVKVVQLKMP